MKNVPVLPIKQFQIYQHAIYVLDDMGRLWGSDDFVNQEKWHDYTSELQYRPAPVRLPPTIPGEKL